jgi:hypothetical protein
MNSSGIDRFRSAESASVGRTHGLSAAGYGVRRLLAVLAALLALVAALAAVGIAHAATPSRTALTKLNGTIGPGYTIALRDSRGKSVTKLAHGTYTFVIHDKASIHNFTLNGPGIKDKTITGTTFVGTKTVTVTVRKGRYRYFCTVHPTITGAFRVT